MTNCHIVQSKALLLCFSASWTPARGSDKLAWRDHCFHHQNCGFKTAPSHFWDERRDWSKTAGTILDIYRSYIFCEQALRDDVFKDLDYLKDHVFSLDSGLNSFIHDNSDLSSRTNDQFNERQLESVAKPRFRWKQMSSGLTGRASGLDWVPGTLSTL